MENHYRTGQPNILKEGANIFTIRSGDKATPFQTDSGENRDDYSFGTFDLYSLMEPSFRIQNTRILKK